MEYIVLKPAYLLGKEQPVGAVLTGVDQELANKLISRGTLAVNDGTQPAQEVTADPTPLVETPVETEVLTVQNQEVQPTQETITEDLTVAEAGSQVQPTNLNIQ